MASDTESIPSAVATTLPLRYPVIISTIPIARRVTTDIFAILLPAIIPSRTKLEEDEDVAELLELLELLLLLLVAAVVVAESLLVLEDEEEDDDEEKEEGSLDESSNFIILVYNDDCLYLKYIFELL
jgi:hypothetical protein